MGRPRETNNADILKGKEIRALPVTTLEELRFILHALRKEGTDEKETASQETPKYGAGHAQETLMYLLLNKLERVGELK